jgi:hypothetical protein
MKLIGTRLFRIATLSAAFLLLAPAATQAQAGLVGAGRGSYLTADGQDTLDFTFVVAEGRDGSTHGYAVWRGPESVTVWEVTSAMFHEGALLFAGPIVAVVGNAPPGHVVGRTAFSGFRDNGFRAVDETVSLSVVPPQFGNPTIQEIVMFAGAPPPQAWRPLTRGQVWTR